MTTAQRLRLVAEQLRREARQAEQNALRNRSYEKRIAAHARARAYAKAARMVKACL